jgi:hypothetical protein
MARCLTRKKRNHLKRNGCGLENVSNVPGSNPTLNIAMEEALETRDLVYKINLCLRTKPCILIDILQRLFWRYGTQHNDIQ